MKRQNTYSNNSVFKNLSLVLVISIVIMLLPGNVSAIGAGLYAVAAYPDSDTQVQLEWNPVAGAQKYQILRDDDGAGGSGFVPIGTIDPDTVLNATSYTDMGLTPKTEYTYQVKAYLENAMQNEITLTGNTATVETSEMIKPAGLSSVYNINTKDVTLKWETASEAALGCEVFVNGDFGTSVASAVYSQAKEITFDIPDDTQPVNFVVRSNDNLPIGERHNSGYSIPITVTPADPPTVTAAVSSGAVNISWGSFAQISEFQLERSQWTGSAWGGWSTIDSTLAGTNTIDLPDQGGIYRYRLAGKVSGKYLGYSNASGSINWGKSPSNLVCTIADNNTIQLTWTNAPGNESELWVLRKTSANTYSLLATLDKSVTGYTDNLPTPIVLGTTYEYMVYAANGNANGGNTYGSVTAEIPSAPANLTLTANSRTSVTLNWQDNSNSETNFVIERKVDAGSYTELSRVGANVRTFPNTVDASHTYAFRVKAINGLGESAYSNAVSIVMNNVIVPGTLSVTPVSASQIDLTWSYPGIASYSTVIERKTGTNGAWSVIKTTNAGVYTFSNTGLTANTQYFYRVSNFLGTGITGTPYPDDGIGAYTMMSVLSLDGEPASGGRIRLEWSGSLEGSEVVIEKKMASGSFSVMATVPHALGEWYDTSGLIPGASYTYRIKVQNSSNQSVYSNEKTIENVFLEAPLELSAKANATQGIDLAWRDNSDGETGFEIWRKVHGEGSMKLYVTVDGNKTRYTDTNVQNGVQYDYKVRAYLTGDKMYSDFTDTESAGLGIVDPPDELEYSYIDDNDIRLLWVDNSSDESGFKIEQKTGAGGEWEIIDSVPRNTEKYKVSNLNPYISYFFRIRAYKSSGSYDSFSNEIEVMTGIPKAPSGVSAAPVAPGIAKITWTDNSTGEAGFKVLRAIKGSTYYSTIVVLDKDKTTYTDYNLGSGGTAYSYKVAAYNDSGSAESEPADMVTSAIVRFSDLASGFWAREAIENLAGRGIIKGDENSRYRPNDTITRAEFTALMIRAFNLETAPVGSFADVRIGKWYYDVVMAAENLGIVTGDPANRFYPERAITREEMAVIMVKTLNAVGKPLNGHSNDVLERFWDRDLISPYAVSSLAAVVGENVMTGLPGNAIAAKKTSTRAEAAALIYRIIDR